MELSIYYIYIYIHRGRNHNLLSSWCYHYITKREVPMTMELTKSFKEREDVKKVYILIKTITFDSFSVDS